MAPWVTIAIPTYNRPQGLRRLLEALQRLEFGDAEPPRVSILVVENDAAEPNRAWIDAFESRFPIRYMAEPAPGLSQARNRCLDSVDPDCSLIAFLDDDEIPEAQWLDALLRVRSDFSADVAAGPVLPEISGKPAGWDKEIIRFACAARHPDGTQLGECGCGNVLLDMALAREDGLRFHPAFDQTGGEDVLFFKQARRRGRRIVASAQAVVRESLGPERRRLAWWLKRSYRIGVTEAMIGARLGSPIVSNPAHAGLGVARVLGHGLLLAPSTLFGRFAAAQTLRRVMTGAGNVAGALGFAYREYARDA